jgi:hypothetical protein
MDTTWRVLRLYVTSILTVVIGNVGIPIAVSFGPVEDTALYETFYTTLMELFRFDLSTFTVESDQGSALRAICKKYQNPHLACLRHLLVSLGRGTFAFEIGNLVRCRSQVDFDRLKERYETLFSSVEKSQRGPLKKTLRKVGLDLKRGRIVIGNAERWHEVSMMERVETAMPTTTNSLESTHGHLNADTPRRNSFWPSLHRIIGAILTKSTNFWSCIQHNFADEVCESLTRFVKTDPVVMQQEMDWYKTTPRSCGCGETIHLSKMYGVRMPCSHQYCLGVAKPSVPQAFKLTFEETWADCVLEIRTLERQAPDPSPAHATYVKDLAVRNIKRFSGSRSKEEIGQYVEDNLVMSPDFALGLPISVFDLISRGIEHFRKK